MRIAEEYINMPSAKNQRTFILAKSQSNVYFWFNRNDFYNENRNKHRKDSACMYFTDWACIWVRREPLISGILRLVKHIWDRWLYTFCIGCATDGDIYIYIFPHYIYIPHIMHIEVYKMFSLSYFDPGCELLAKLKIWTHWTYMCFFSFPFLLWNCYCIWSRVIAITIAARRKRQSQQPKPQRQQTMKRWKKQSRMQRNGEYEWEIERMRTRKRDRKRGKRWSNIDK